MMEGFIISIIATAGFGVIFTVIFFSVYYLYLKGNEENKGEGKAKSKNKRLRKRILK